MTAEQPRPAATPAKPGATPKARPRPKRKAKRRKPNPYAVWAKRLARTRPGLTGFVLTELATRYGPQPWERRLDPTSELVLTVLTQSTADANAEQGFEALRLAYPSGGPLERHAPGRGWGGVGLPDGAAPDWSAVENAPYPELVEVIRPAGLPFAKAKTIQAALAAIREARGDYSLEFLGEMPALEARAWLVAIPGIGVKTASVVLLFSFGTPLMPVDRHVERVSQRLGLLPRKADANQAHDYFLAMLEPDEMHEAHVNLIHHGRVVCQARKPDHDRCPLRARCRFYDPKAP